MTTVALPKWRIAAELERVVKINSQASQPSTSKIRMFTTPHMLPDFDEEAVYSDFL